MKKNVLAILEANMNQFISGEVIAAKLNKTRAYVWKEIQRLKAQGYQILATENKGYQLVSLDKNIFLPRILSLLEENTLSDLEYLESVDSTNDYAKQKALATDLDNYLILSDLQTSGRGRMGRSFYSPAKNGIYMSFILRPRLELRDTQLITIAAALAVAKAIKASLDIEVGIKWLNDIYAHKRKLCGILTEGEIVLESNSYRYIILGIGLNVYSDPHLPQELKEIYTALDALTDKEIDRNVLVASIINHFYQLYRGLPDKRQDLLHEYRKSCIVLGQEISISQRPGERFIALDIDEHGYLIVEDPDKKRLTLNAGEISIDGAFKNES